MRSKDTLVLVILACVAFFGALATGVVTMAQVVNVFASMMQFGF